MGKTEHGAIWLNKDMLSPYDYWQFWRNTDDRDVIKFLKMFTELSLNEINELKSRNINELKILLANNATAMLHGDKEAKKSEILAINTFKDNSTGEKLPDIKVNSDILSKNIVEVISFINKTISKSEIRRLIKSKAIKVDNKNIQDEKYIIESKLLSEKGYIKLSIGKKKHYKIVN